MLQKCSIVATPHKYAMFLRISSQQKKDAQICASHHRNENYFCLSSFSDLIFSILKASSDTFDLSDLHAQSGSTPDDFSRVLSTITLLAMSRKANTAMMII